MLFLASRHPSQHRSLGSPLLALMVAVSALLGVPRLDAQTVPPVVPGFPNVAQTPGALLSGLNAPGQGRTAVIAYHNGVLYTVPEIPSSQPGSDYIVRSWDISDPTDPAITETFGQTAHPVMAHGYLKIGDYLSIGGNWPPETPWSFQRVSPGVNTRTTSPELDGVFVRGHLYQPWFAGNSYWSYNAVEGDATVSLRGVELARWDHLGLTGVIGHPFIVGDLLIFASDQSRTGVATYDISDPTNPVLLDVLTTGGPGGYWPELWGGDGRLYVVFPYRTGGNGFRVVDVTDPSDLQFLTDRPLSGDSSMYIQFQDQYAFMGSHKVDMRSFESVLDLDGANAVRPNDGGIGVDTSQFLLPIGNLLVTGGAGPNQGMAIWAHQAAPDTQGPTVGYHIPQAGRTGYPVGAPISLLIHETLETPTLINGVTFIVRPLGGSAIPGRLTFSFGDVLTFTPDSPLDADTTYEVVLPAGGLKDAAGNGTDGYSFTFSTGSTVGGNGPPSVDSFTASSYPAPPGQTVTLSAMATDPEAQAVEYRFDFGDGSPATAWSSAASAPHVYAAAGHYSATVQARDPEGALATARTTVTVTDAAAEDRPTRSTPIFCAESTRRVWRVNPDNDSVTALDADTLSVIGETPVCDDPRAITQASTGALWVACHDDDRLRVLDASGNPIDSIDTGYGSAPIAVAADPAGNAIFATFEGGEDGIGELRRYDASSRQETGRLALGPLPRAIAISGDGTRVLVTRFLSPLNHAEVWEVNATSMTLARTLRLPKLGGVQNRDDTAGGRGVPNDLVGLALSPAGTSPASDRAWIASSKPNTERGLFFFDDLDTDNTVRNIATELDLGAGVAATDTVRTTVDLDNSDSASAVAYSPLGDYVFVTLQGNDEVIVLDTLATGSASGLGSFVTRLGTGSAPQGVCIDPTTQRTFVQDFTDRTVTVLETADLFQHGTRTAASTTIDAVGSEALAANVLLGKQIFYRASDPQMRMSAEGYLSCATCHLDGGHDGRTWDFTGRGEGFRNTTTLRGRGGMAHGNVHWTANFDEIQDFEHDIRGPFGGLGFMDDDDFAATNTPLGPAKAGLSPELDAMAAYVSSLDRSTLPKSPYRDASGALTVEAEAGRLVFRDLGCNSCHAGASFTDSTLTNAGGTGETLHDVGTLRTTSGQRLGGLLNGIDTPTVLGVWTTAPYFHDGSAPTLEDVFQVAGGTVLQAEDATPAGASVVNNFVLENNDDTLHGRAYVRYTDQGDGMVFTNVEGGSGGIGAVELRYASSYNSATVEVWVNGVLAATGTTNPTGNDPLWRLTNWEILRIEGVALAAGSGNTIEIRTTSPFPYVGLDDILISTADDLARALPHRSALALPPVDRDALLAYLRQLDGSPESNPIPGIFSDGFESGDASAWSATVGD